MTTRSPQSARRTSRIVAALSGLVLAVTGGVALLIPAAPASAARFSGVLTEDDRTERHDVTVARGTLHAALVFKGTPPAEDRPLRLSLALRDDAGVLITRVRGKSGFLLSAKVAPGDYRLRVRALRPLGARDVSYRLQTTIERTPTPPPTADDICGTWVLYQVTSVKDLQNLRTRIEDAVALPGVVGFSVRFPWDAADLTGSQTTHPILDEAADIAEETGKALSIRFMAGAHTPQRVFDAGASYYSVGTKQIPLPWDNATGSHQVFLDAYRDYTAKLKTWSEAHDVRLLHLSWYGEDWAELNHGADVRDADGYTYTKWLEGHKDLIDVGTEFASEQLTVELPLSGYGPLSDGQSASLADHIIQEVGPGSREFLVQANGWDETQEWGSPNSGVEAAFDEIWAKPIERGLQMIQPDGYGWDQVFDRLVEVDGIYGEVYLPSFWQVPGPFGNNTTGKISQLEAEIAAFSDQHCS